MITIKYDRPSNETIVELERFTIFKEEDLPLIVEFRKVVNGELAWMTPLAPGNWAKWKGAETPHDVIVNTANHENAYTWKYQVDNVGSSIEKSMYFFIKSFGRRTRGLVIGPHNGLFGHWVFPVHEDLCDVVMVDGGKQQLDQAMINYSHLTNVEFINEIITTDGRTVTWMEGGEGFTDTVYKPVISKFLKDDAIQSSTRSSVSINQFINRYDKEFDWIHLDVEGTDGELILALNSRPKMIVFESMHMSNNKYSEVLDWMQDNNYKLFNDGSDCIAIKK